MTNYQDGRTVIGKKYNGVDAWLELQQHIIFNAI